MKSRIWAASLAVMIALMGCGDFLDEGDHEGVTSGLAVVKPEFRVSGLDDLPQELFLKRLGLSVVEIRLEPLDAESRGLTYVTNDPVELVFDLAKGEDRLQRDRVELPETGRFLVSIRLGPNSDSTGILAEDGAAASLGMEGMVRDNFLVREDRADGDDDGGEDHDGNPLPLPFERFNEADKRVKRDGMWTQFRYTSQQAVNFTFSEVVLMEGEQVLTFDFDLSEWASRAARPLVDAVETARSEGPLDAADAIVEIDVEREGLGEMPVGLLESGTVSTTLGLR